MFDELKEVKYFKEVTDFYRVLQCKILLKNKIFKKKKKKKSLQKAEAHLQPKRASTMEHFYEYI